MLQNLNKENRINFNWRNFLPLRDQLGDKLRQLVNQKDNIHYLDCRHFWPELVEKILADFLLALDIILERPLSEPSRKYIVHMWLDTRKMREDDAMEVIGIERGFGNKLVRPQEQQNIQKIKNVLRLTNLG